MIQIIFQASGIFAFFNGKQSAGSYCNCLICVTDFEMFDLTQSCCNNPRNAGTIHPTADDSQSSGSHSISSPPCRWLWCHEVDGTFQGRADEGMERLKVWRHFAWNESPSKRDCSLKLCCFGLCCDNSPIVSQSMPIVEDANQLKRKKREKSWA